MHLITTLILTTLVTANAEYNLDKTMKEFYEKCKSPARTGEKKKCIGIPGDCLKTKKCIWVAFVSENKTHLEGSLLQTCDHAARAERNPTKWPQQSFMGYGWATYDKTMTKIECRMPEMGDYKFFVLFNDTICQRDPNDEAYSVSTRISDRGEYFDKCRANENSEVIPSSTSPVSTFNLAYFLQHYILHFSATPNFKEPYTFADTIEYQVKDQLVYHSEKN